MGFSYVSARVGVPIKAGMQFKNSWKDGSITFDRAALTLAVNVKPYVEVDIWFIKASHDFFNISVIDKSLRFWPLPIAWE